MSEKSSQTSYHHEEIADWQSVANIMHVWHPDLKTHAKRIIDERSVPVDLTQHEPRNGRNVKVHETEQLPQHIFTNRHLRRSELAAASVSKPGILRLNKALDSLSERVSKFSTTFIGKL